jgi:hypothetical protein
MFNYITVVEWRSYGSLWDSVAFGGVSCLLGDAGLGLTTWAFATRASIDNRIYNLRTSTNKLDQI